MKTRDILEYLRRERGHLFASWGDAELLPHLDGRCELRGGTPQDRQAASEWISRLMPQAAVPN